MAAIKAGTIVLARPGTYTYPWGEMEKTAEDLKSIPSYNPTIKILLGHPETGKARRRDFLGYVKPIWCEENQALIGKPWYYGEHFHKVPKVVAEKIVNREDYDISLDYTIDDEAAFKAGKLNGSFVDHVSVLRPGEEPVCPSGTCGVNVDVQESVTMPESIREKAPPPEGESEIETPAETTAEEDRTKAIEIEMQSMRDENAALKEMVEKLTEVTAEAEPEKEDVAEPQAVAKVEPEPVPALEVPHNIGVKELPINDEGNLEIIVPPKPSVG